MKWRPQSNQKWSLRTCPQSDQTEQREEAKNMKNKKKQQFGKLDRLLELPKEVCSNVPKIIITGFDEMLIENFKK